MAETKWCDWTFPDGTTQNQKKTRSVAQTKTDTDDELLHLNPGGNCRWHNVCVTVINNVGS